MVVVVVVVVMFILLVVVVVVVVVLVSVVVGSFPSSLHVGSWGCYGTHTFLIEFLSSASSTPLLLLELPALLLHNVLAIQNYPVRGLGGRYV